MESIIIVILVRYTYSDNISQDNTYCITHFYLKLNSNLYYIRLYFTVFLLARSNTRDIPFSNILISRKQFLCNKKSHRTLMQNK